MDSHREIAGKRIAFVGKLGCITRKEASMLVKQHGGTFSENVSKSVDWIVWGADELAADMPSSELNSEVQDLIRNGQIQILSETDWMQRLGLLESVDSLRQLYTPAMLAELLGISVRVVRRWHRAGLITPVKVIHRLPYFDFQEVASAKRLAGWIASGKSPTKIESQLKELAQWLPAIGRSLAQLSILVEGKQLLLREDGGLIEPGGQFRIDFDALDSPTNESLPPTSQVDTLPFPDQSSPQIESAATLVERAQALEDEGDYDNAANWLRLALAYHGPNADICFQLAEILYRSGDVTAARERYYMAIELDSEMVEARANLGCVLSELKQHDLAIAAFQGALAIHEAYADVHFHLAQALEEIGRNAEAEVHWNRFRDLAPTSPWSVESSTDVTHVALTDPSVTR